MSVPERKPHCGTLPAKPKRKTKQLENRQMENQKNILMKPNLPI